MVYLTYLSIFFLKQMKKKIICSACLLGDCCRYNGKSKPNDKAKALLDTATLIKVCPERLGGLPTPRLPAEYKNGKVVDSSGADLTREFKKGAEAVLRIAQKGNVKMAVLKQRSPSCGCGQLTMLDGSIISGYGVTAQTLRDNGIEVISEEEL